MGKVSDRNYRLTPVTIDFMRQMPSWMKMANDTQSNGFKFMNALAGREMERIDKALDWLDANLTFKNAYLNEVSQIYAAEFDSINSELEYISAISVIDDAPKSIQVEIVDDREFFYNPPTRITATETYAVPSATFPSGYASAGIIGVEYVYDYPESPSGAYIVSHNITNDAEVSGVAFYDEDWNLLEQKQYGVIEQSYETQGFDEILYPESSGELYFRYKDSPEDNPYGSGVYTTATGVFEHTPIQGTVRMYDILNIDEEGNAIEVMQSGNVDDHISGILWSVNGDEWTFTNANSRYATTYKYLEFEKTICLTTEGRRDHISTFDVINGEPTITSMQYGYNGTVVPHEAIRSDGVGVRVDPLHVRHGNVAHVDLEYTATATGVWTSPSVSGYTYTITDPNFTEASVPGVFVFELGTTDYIRADNYVTPVVSGSYVEIPASSVLGTSSLGVHITYKAETTIDATGVQSYSATGNHPYPYDYQIVEFNREQYVKPYTILPLSSADSTIAWYLASGDINNFTVRFDREYVGITFSDDNDVMHEEVNRNSFYIMERNNHILYRRKAVDFELDDQWALFCPDPAMSGYVGTVIPSGLTFDKQDEAIDIYGIRRKRFVYSDQDGGQVDKYDYKTFKLLAYEMHTGLTYNNNGMPIAGGSIYRDLRGLVFYDGQLIISSAETDDSNFVWPKSSGVFEAASTDSNLAYGQLYMIPTADLLNGTEVVHVELPNDNLRLGRFCPNPIDMTLDKEENLLIVDGSGVKKVKFHYDYATVVEDQSSNKTTVYYREPYDEVFDV